MCPCKNVGTVDRIVRAGVGIVALIVAFTSFRAAEGATLGVVACIAGVIMLATGLLGMCPLYIPFKLSTCKVQGKP